MAESYGALLTPLRSKLLVKLGVKRYLDRGSFPPDVATKFQIARSCSGQGYMDSETGKHRVIVTDPKGRQNIRLILPDIGEFLYPAKDRAISSRHVNKSEMLPYVKHWHVNCLAGN
jgi:hypothetical protein